MMTWIMENLGTVLVSAGLLLIVVLVIVKLIRDRKKGKTACGCGCAHCAMADACHSKK